MFIFFELIGFQLFFFFLSSSARSISLKAHTNKVKLCEITRRNGGRSKSSSQPDFGNNHQREFAGRNKKKRAKKMRLGRNRLQYLGRKSLSISKWDCLTARISRNASSLFLPLHQEETIVVVVVSKLQDGHIRYKSRGGGSMCVCVD